MPSYCVYGAKLIGNENIHLRGKIPTVLIEWCTYIHVYVYVYLFIVVSNPALSPKSNARALAAVRTRHFSSQKASIGDTMPDSRQFYVKLLLNICFS